MDLEKKEIFKILKKTNNNKSLPIIITTTTALICRVKTSRIESRRVKDESNRVITQPSNISE